MIAKKVPSGAALAERIVDYAKHSNRSHDTVIRVYDDAGNVIETHEHKGDFKEWRRTRFGFEPNKKPLRYVDSHRRWQQIPELIEPSRITLA